MHAVIVIEMTREPLILWFLTRSYFKGIKVMSQKLSNVYNNEDSNMSGNADFESVMKMRLNRRNMLLRTAGAWGTGALASMGLGACASGNATGTAMDSAIGSAKLSTLGFTAVPKHLSDAVSVPIGYQAQIFYALGDPLASGVAAYKNDGTDTDFDKRAGDHHDGME